jgi:hypothetical protein
VAKKIAARTKTARKLITVEAQVFVLNAMLPQTLARKVIPANWTSLAKKMSVTQVTLRLVTEIFTNSVSVEHVSRLLAQVILTVLTIQHSVRQMDCAYTIRTNVIAMIHLPATVSIIIAKQASVSLEIVLTKIALKFLTLHGSMKKKSNL